MLKIRIEKQFDKFVSVVTDSNRCDCELFRSREYSVEMIDAARADAEEFIADIESRAPRD